PSLVRTRGGSLAMALCQAARSPFVNLAMSVLARLGWHISRKPFANLIAGWLLGNVLEIILDGIADSVRPHPLAALGCTFRCELTSEILRLPEGKNVCAVSVGEVIGMPDALNDVLPSSDIDARNPSPRILALAV